MWLSRDPGDVLRGPLGDDPAAFLATLGPEVDDPVGRLDDVEVVLDDHHRVPAVDQPVEHGEQLLHVVEVEAGGGLVEDVEGAAGAHPGQLPRQLDALGLAAGEGGGGLPELHVAEPHVVERHQDPLDLAVVGEVEDGLAHREVEHLGDVLPLEMHLERGLVEALPLAHLAGDEHVGQEVHLHHLHPVALAGLAAASLDVEAEAAGQVAERAGLRRLGEDVAHQVEDLGVGGRVGAWGSCRWAAG